MDINPINTDTHYRAVLKEVELLMTSDPNTPEGEELDILVTLIEAYERKHFPLDLPDPAEANKAPRRKQRGINCALQSAGFQPAFAPRGGELNPQRLNLKWNRKA